MTEADYGPSFQIIAAAGDSNIPYQRLKQLKMVNLNRRKLI